MPTVLRSADGVAGRGRWCTGPAGRFHPCRPSTWSHESAGDELSRTTRAPSSNLSVVPARTTFSKSIIRFPCRGCPRQRQSCGSRLPPLCGGCRKRCVTAGAWSLARLWPPRTLHAVSGRRQVGGSCARPAAQGRTAMSPGGASTSRPLTRRPPVLSHGEGAFPCGEENATSARDPASRRSPRQEPDYLSAAGFTGRVSGRVRGRLSGRVQRGVQWGFKRGGSAGGNRNSRRRAWLRNRPGRTDKSG